MHLNQLARKLLTSTLSFAPFALRPAQSFANLAMEASQKRGARKIQKSGSIDIQEGVVLEGPFGGLRYPSLKSFGSVLLPKLLGVYEFELHPTIFRLARTREYKTIIDIGAAEGYYAIGLARLFPTSDVIAFEEKPDGQKMCREMAEINNCSDRIQVLGRCTRKELADLAQGSTPGLIFCDCEGAETHLLLEDDSQTFSEFDVLVELHETRLENESVAERFYTHFRNSHDFMFINIQPFRKAPQSAREILNNDELMALLNEKRHLSVGWCLLEAKRPKPEAKA